ncbi:tRNA (N6-threonylcarbamoyladenosine(37)-N6)-methyltransferase TrmO [Iocasia frigidifontis]|uniref:tRNA (N6-threonylcarbamoyladenosine(37)-N6)-methyltransferase TrmO n=1 Tax=Iocasia fonsfrigidae TaxID=2682810 RepID=A0A8A7KAX1_9FIRM|nr:tRNA (N6-threonylcarbamoyladenosine(37)-N6)-methyltransferase TrmO [Iocasia fonsfrigidae]QTL96668.1 tRNA (N6-threonylcarbamoyladenosine(37)-N6)-methyltransferase TrmO [Iocasia fonsfrigidae]
MSKKEFVINPLGYVRHNGTGFYLELLEKYAGASRGLEGFNYINVLWWANLTDGNEYRAILECEQPYKGAPEKVGVFATRSPGRPNPISLSSVNVLSLEKGKIHVAYIDAEDGTPIIDIKPYHPSLDRIRDVKVPDWCSHWPKWYEDSAVFNWEAEFISAR